MYDEEFELRELAERGVEYVAAGRGQQADLEVSDVARDLEDGEQSLGRLGLLLCSASGVSWRPAHHEYAMLVESIQAVQARCSLGMFADEGGIEDRLTLRAQADEALQRALGGVSPDAADTRECCCISCASAAATYDGCEKGWATRGCQRPRH